MAGDELRRRLLALNAPDYSHPLDVGQDCDLEIRWQHKDFRRSRFALSRHSSSSHVRFLLDEQRHELRMNQVDSGSGFFLGLEGWLPRLQGYASMSAGPPGQRLTKDISHMAYRSGWTVRPVLWWFQATHSGSRWLQALTPAPLRRWPARRFWGGAVSAQVLPGHRFSGRHHRPAGPAHAPDAHRRLRHLVGHLGLAGLGVERLSGLVATPARSRSAGEHAAADGDGGRGSRRRLEVRRQPICWWRLWSHSSRMPPLSASPRSAP